MIRAISEIVLAVVASFMFATTAVALIVLLALCILYETCGWIACRVLRLMGEPRP